MKPTVKQEQIVKEQLENEDNLIGELSPHEAELLKRQREEEDSLRQLSAHLEDLNPERFPTFEELRLWKATYARFYLSSIVEDDDVYIWRPIYRQEWKEFISTYQNAPDEERQTGLIQKCLSAAKLPIQGDTSPEKLRSSLFLSNISPFLRKLLFLSVHLIFTVTLQYTRLYKKRKEGKPLFFNFLL